VHGDAQARDLQERRHGQAALARLGRRRRSQNPSSRPAS
jgi:hypothetical protein